MAMPAIEMTGKSFGLLTVRRRAGGSPRPKWLCRCNCGREVIKDGYRLRRGHVKSCGCATRELIGDARRTHGMTGSRLEYIRRGMVARCYRSSRKDYPRYGGRGIRICHEWLNDVGAFYSWALGSGYEDSLSIDRIDSDGDYCPENCQWIPLSENVAKANRLRRTKR